MVKSSQPGTSLWPRSVRMLVVVVAAWLTLIAVLPLGAYLPVSWWVLFPNRPQFGTIHLVMSLAGGLVAGTASAFLLRRESVIIIGSLPCIPIAMRWFLKIDYVGRLGGQMYYSGLVVWLLLAALGAVIARRAILAMGSDRIGSTRSA